MRKFDNFSGWFDDTLFDAEVMDDRYPIKGFSVYKPWGARVAKRIIGILEDQLEATGHDPALFPVAISEDAFAREAEHIKGFTTQVFWITHAGNRRLQKKMLLRPTSETAMYPMFAYWVRSHADLPLRLYQSGSVYRYETKATRPLLRMREFLWNEAHTAHEDWDGAERQVKQAIQIYKTVFGRLSLSYYMLKRPDFDKFAGAEYSIAFDAWNPDGRVNQIGTVHNLGQNFAKAFEITFEDADGTHKNVSQTCYGFGTSRTLAAVIAQHGDDYGMVLPPEIAPIQVVVVPIPYKEVESKVEGYAKEVYEELRNAGFRAHLDEEEKTPGEKYYHWEMLGVPVRVEVGPRDLEKRRATASERVDKQRTTVALEEIAAAVRSLLEAVTKSLEARSLSTLKSMTTDADDMSSLIRAIRAKKIARVCWCEDVGCAETINGESGGEIRGHRIDVEEKPWSPCVVCGRKAERVVYVARAY